MKIGLDLDHTVYGFPEFFKEFIPAMISRGHEIYCSSNHTQEKWKNIDQKKLQKLGIDPNTINYSLMPMKPVIGTNKEHRYKHKAIIANLLDVVFDDHANIIQEHTQTPIFGCPGRLSKDWLKHLEERKLNK